MPGIILNRETIDKQLGKKLDDDKLIHTITFLGAEVESIDKKEIHVDVTPNRPDLLSEQGIARAMAYFLGLKKAVHTYEIKKGTNEVLVNKAVERVRPFTVCAIIRGLKFTDEKIREIIQIQEKLHITFGRNRKKIAIGIYPLEKIKFPVTYTAAAPEEIVFQPLDFPRELTGHEILLEHQTGKEYAHLLEGKEVYPYFIDANKKILSMPPIINSNDVGKINEATKDVFIECSGFNLKILEQCLSIVVTTLSDMGGSIESVNVKYGSKTHEMPNLLHTKRKLSLDYANKILGTKLTETQLKECLEKTGLIYNKGEVKIPSFRVDILHEIDLVEEVAIGFGYENFHASLPKVATIGKEHDSVILQDRISEILIGFGIQEVKTMHLLGNHEQTKLVNVDYPSVELANSVSQEHNALRFWIIPSLLLTLKNNRNNPYPQKIFELGRVFTYDKHEKEESRVIEFERFAVTLCGEKTDFTSIKQISEYLFKVFGLKCEIVEHEHSSFIRGRVGRIICDGVKLGVIGEIHPSVLENFELEVPVAALEINFTELWNIVKKK